MWKLCGVVCMLILTTVSAAKIFRDYEEYSDIKHEDDLGHWKGVETDHNSEGRGQRYQHDHFYDHSGVAAQGDNKAGGHVKHHVTKGYKDFHHKDEVGQTTRYIDSSGDSGDHHKELFLHNKWGNRAMGAAHGGRYENGYKGEEGVAEKNVGLHKEKKEDHKERIGDFLYVKKPISYEKKFYSHVPLQYVPYPHYYY